MSRLIDLIDDTRTDKNTCHSYIDLYDTLLASKKETARNVLEVGIFEGGSIKLWSQYFTNATVYGLDIRHYDNIWEELKNKENIKLFSSYDAYNDETFATNFLSTGVKFDFMLDDGPHTLESMIQFIKLYSQIMADDGILIIEDVDNVGWLDILRDATPEHLKPYIQTYDLRHNKNRWDDIVFTIDKNPSF